MAEENRNVQPEGNKLTAGAMKEARQAYESFDSFVAVREEDSTLVIAGKLILCFMGIVIMIVLSPFLLIGLAIAFAAVL